MQHETKTYSAEFKAIDAARGTFEAVVSVFGNVDLGGDRVMPGAFTDTLEAWKSKGDPIPVIWSHQWDDPKSHIGSVTDAAERPDLGGLWVRGSLDVDANDRAAYVARLLKQRRVTQFSFGYSTKDSRVVTDEATGDPVRELMALDLFEVGPTLLGMNPATQLLEAASATASKAPGRILSRKDERTLAKARDLIDSVLNAADETADTGKAADEFEAKDADPEPQGDTEAPDKTEDAGDGTEDTPGSRDNADRLSDNSELVHLLARTRHEETYQ